MHSCKLYIWCDKEYAEASYFIHEDVKQTSPNKKFLCLSQISCLFISWS